MNTLNITSDAPGQKLFLLGNHAIARGALEAGVQVVAAYPGTPSTEIAEALIEVAPSEGIQAQWSVNEKVAFGTAMGAALCGRRALAIMKHVGVNLILDPLMTSSYVGTRGGLVLIEAADPGQWSSQNEQDNRYIAREAYLPVLEPSSAEEARRMVSLAFELSEKYQHPFMLRSSTRLGHSRSDITLGEIVRPNRPGHFEKDPDRYVMVPAVARRGRRRIIERLNQMQAEVDSWDCHSLEIKANAGLGIITSGLAYAYTREALNWLGLAERVSLLKIGSPHPLPRQLIDRLLRASPRVLVIEELEPFIEDQVRVLAQSSALNVDIHGKDVVPLIGELSTRKVMEAVSRISGAALPLDFGEIDRRVEDVRPLLPYRPPTLCPGCPHRASHYAMNLVCRQVQREKGVEILRSGDIGCYALGGEAPLSAIDTSLFMGSGFDVANGMAQALDTPIIAHMGDSTFFHSGVAPLLNAVQHRTRLVMVVLDNLITAMTGSQPSPASQTENAEQIRPEKLARAAGIRFVRVVDPLDLNKAVRTLRRAVDFNGPALVVFRRPCNILEQREMRQRGEKTVPYFIDSTLCLAERPAPCTAACPLEVDARAYIKALKDQNWSEALAIIRDRLPFPAILGRVCTQPCRSSCRRAEVDQALASAALKRAAVEYGGNVTDSVPEAPSRPQKVAVIGSGPAGLLCAHDLRRQGYGVTVFEALPFPGGMLSAGIPEYRLPAAVVRSEIEKVLSSGIDLRLNTRIGPDLPLSRLRSEYQAVFIAAGAQQARCPELPGCTAEGVVSGIDFLRKLRLAKPAPLSGAVVIIGGGNVAVDCARACLRLGAASVQVVYRRTREDMPAIAQEVAAAAQEGVQFEFLAAPLKIQVEQGRAGGLECVRTRAGRPGADGRRAFHTVPGAGFSLKADLIILATGETPDLAFLSAAEAAPELNGGLLKADPATLVTSLPGVFAGGDVVSGPSSVVEALAAGRRAALAIDRYLNGLPPAAEPGAAPLPDVAWPAPPRDTAPQSMVGLPALPLSARQGWQEVETGYSREEAACEAGRCLECHCLVCVTELGCPAITVANGKPQIDRAQCTGCGLCALICPSGAIQKERPE